MTANPSQKSFLYTAFYCEENVWQLNQHSQFTDKERVVVFISNENRLCPLWGHRAARSIDEPVFWDYHVILLCRDGNWKVWDLDSVVGMPIDLAMYVGMTFPPIPADHVYAARLKIIDPKFFAENFSSDRSHMLKGNGKWRAEPPAWPPILPTPESNLDQFIDMNDETFGEVLTVQDFTARFA